MAGSKIKVLIVDDSAVIRKLLSDILNASPKIEVVSTAIDPIIAFTKIEKFKPDVLTLDVEMPRMDGITFLKKIMKDNPIPSIMVSSKTEKSAISTIRALENGAVDFILKPSIQSQDDMDDFAKRLVNMVIAAYSTTPKKLKKPTVPNFVLEEKHTADVILAKKDPMKIKALSEKVIAIGASTGGTEVLDAILCTLPENLPGIVIAQHMPETFTKAFADRVNDKSSLYVKEATNGDRLYKGMAVIAPGGKHMLLRADKNGYWIEVNDGPKVNRHKPSVDVLFRSVAQTAGKQATGVICTGMGNDGAQGMLELRQAGATTIGQNESSCIVYGMPKEAFKLGAIQSETDINGIISKLKLLAPIS